MKARLYAGGSLFWQVWFVWSLPPHPMKAAAAGEAEETGRVIQPSKNLLYPKTRTKRKFSASWRMFSKISGI